MKKCMKCGKLNNNESNFCGGCGSEELAFVQEMPPQPPRVMPRPQQETLDIYDALMILGFASALAGLIEGWIILEPLGIAASSIAFIKGRRYKALSLTGGVISLLAFVMILVRTLYEAGIIPRWIAGGIL